MTCCTRFLVEQQETVFHNEGVLNPGAGFFFEVVESPDSTGKTMSNLT